MINAADTINQMNENICPVCQMRNTNLARVRAYSRTGQLRCQRCGEFDITIEALAIIGHLDDEVRPIISGWISDQNRAGSLPRIDSNTLEDVSKRAPLRFSDKARRLIMHFAERTTKYGEWVRIWEPIIESRLQTFDEEQIKHVAGYLEEHGWLRHDPRSGRDDV
jgi:hypothetical protein